MKSHEPYDFIVTIDGKPVALSSGEFVVTPNASAKPDPTKPVMGRSFSATATMECPPGTYESLLAAFAWTLRRRWLLWLEPSTLRHVWSFVTRVAPNVIEISQRGRVVSERAWAFYEKHPAVPGQSLQTYELQSEIDRAPMLPWRWAHAIHS